MLNPNGRLLVVVALVLGACLAAGAEQAKAPAAQSKAQMLENLTWAHRCEVSGQLRYAAYARKAEQEGHMTAAVQLWIMSGGEGLHARAAAKEIKRLGGKIEEGVCIPVIRSTKENLEVAAKIESTEADQRWRDSLHSAQEAVHDTTDYEKFDLDTQCPANVDASPEVRLFLMLKTVDSQFGQNCAKELANLDEKQIVECLLAPDGLKMRKQGLKLLKKYGLTWV